jgi:hypothetical protein
MEQIEALHVREHGTTGNLGRRKSHVAMEQGNRAGGEAGDIYFDVLGLSDP